MPTVLFSPTAVINQNTEAPVAGLGTCKPALAFLGDVTIPDNTQLRAGESFTKTWKFQNTGSCPWDSGYYLKWVAGTALATEGKTPVPVTPTGGVITVSVVMTAPSAPGLYSSTWQMQAPDGSVFGEQVYVQIIVIQEETAPAGCRRNMSYVADVTIPDGSLMPLGAAFTKTWRIRNSDECAWGAGNVLALESGNALGSGGPIRVPDTPPGGETNISVAMVAPDVPGDYVSKWRIRDTSGDAFGSTLSVKITVSGDSAPPPMTVTAATLPGSSVGAPTPPNPGAGPPSALPITLDDAQASQIFHTGLSMGNRPNVFAKVGDSITESISFLTQIGNNRYVLGDYSYLQGVIDYYRSSAVRGGNSFNNYSVAAGIGWSSIAPLQPKEAATHPECGDKSPLVCEYDAIKPSVALIMLGTNDSTSNIASGAYERNLSQIVEISIQRGIVPVLSTIPWSQYKDPQPFNTIVFRVAATYNIPVMDYWQVMEALPNHGLGPDLLHPSLPAGYQAGDFTTSGLQYGFNMRNLLALQMLDRLWREVLTQ